MRIDLRRIYEPAEGDEGFVVLVERLWPRGVSKEAAGIDHWAKDVAPSPELRRWYGHDESKWPEFQRRYRAELEDNDEAVNELRAMMSQRERATFVFASKDVERCSAVVLREFLLGDT